jgi:GAF domain-containing protein
MHPYGTSSYEPTELSSELKGVEARGSTREPEQNQARAARVLVEAIRALSGARSSTLIAKIVRRATSSLVDAQGSYYLLRESDALVCVDDVLAGGTARFDEARDASWQGRRLPIAGVVGEVLRAREQRVIADVETDRRIPPEWSRDAPGRSLVLTPVRGTSSDAMIVTFWDCIHEATPHELSLLQDLADVTAIAAENVELCAELERRVERRTLELRDANRDLEAF